MASLSLVRRVAIAATVSTLAAVALAGTAPAATAASTPDLRILTINDFHGRLVPESGGVAGAAVLSGAVQAARAENPNTLFVSAGDNISASAFESYLNHDEPTIDALRTAGLDVSAVGNHEFDHGADDLIHRVIPRYENDPAADAHSDFALGANVYVKGTKTPLLRPYTVKTVGTTRVAFIGVVTPETAGMVSPAGIANVDFGDELTAANREAAEIADGNLADVVILLVHDGDDTTDCASVGTGDSEFDQLVRSASPTIDAIVSGHTHRKYSCVVGGRPVIQTGQYGTNLGVLDITLGSNGHVASIDPSVKPLIDSSGQPIATPDPAVASIVADAKTQADIRGAVEVGKITGDMLRARTSSGAEDRGSYSTLGNTVADVYLWATSANPSYGGTPTQIAFMNPGGLRADLPFGTDGGSVSYREAANVQPFGNTLVTLTLTGAQIKDLLEQQWQPDGASRPKLALGVSKGFSFAYDDAAPRGSRVSAIALNGTPVSAGATYRVVTNSFLAAGGDNFTAFVQGTARADSGQIDLQATIDFFAAASGPIAPSPLGRAYVVGGTPIDEDPAPTTDPTPTPTPTPSSTPTPTTSASATPAWATRTGSLASTGTEAPWPLALIGGILILLAAGAFALRHRRG